jgi:competence protein ComEA
VSEPADLEAAEPPLAEPPPRAALGWYPLGDRLRDALDDRLQSWRARLPARPLVTLLAVAAAAGLALGAWYVLRPAAPAPELSLPRATPGDAAATASSSPASAGTVSPTSDPAAAVTVDVVGAVGRPGLVKVAAGARVADALAAAGGAGPDADLDRLNLAAPLSDGERIYVPHVGEASIPLAVNGSGGTDPGASAGSPPSGGAAPAAPVDLNQAGEQELESLPGVGPATAQAILDYRRQHGPFKSVDDLLNVRGIGPAKLGAIRARVRV